MSPNQLPDEFPLEEVEKAVRVSGYPVQLRAAEELRQHFDVVEEWGFEAEDGGSRRLDLYCVKPLSTARDLETSCRLLVECKRSAYPLLFFRKVTAAIPHFLRITGIHDTVISLTHPRYPLPAADSRFGPGVVHGGEISIERRVPAAICIGLHQLEFVSAGPPIAPILAKVEHVGRKGHKGPGANAPKKISGEWPYRNMVMPMVAAIDFTEQRFRLEKIQDSIFPSLIHALCVVDAPMILATGPEEPLQLRMVDWVRAERHETEAGSTRRDKSYGIDIVHVDYLADYMTQLLSFLNEASEVLERHAPLLRSGRGHITEPYGDDRVIDWESFDPETIKPAQSCS